MQNHLRLQLNSPGLDLRCALDPAALPELLAIVQKYQVPAERMPCPQPPQGFGATMPPRGPRWAERQDRLAEEFTTFFSQKQPFSAETQRIVDFVATLSVEQVWAKTAPQTFGDKILVAIAILEAAGSPFTGRSIQELLVSLREVPSANPKRDLRTLEFNGKVHLVRESPGKLLFLTKAGWDDIGKMIGSDGDAADGDPKIS